MSMWDERYSTEEYAYGKSPNEFLREHYRAIPKGKVLCIAEGEGRNAVFLAEQGYEVTAMDGSRVGLEKAARLAAERGVAIERIHGDLATFDMGRAKWDGIVSIFVPLRTELRKTVHRRVVEALKPGGVFLIEAYRPEQLAYRTGGGDSADRMVGKADLAAELVGLRFDRLEEVERSVVEGRYHTGMAAVVQAIAVK